MRFGACTFNDVSKIEVLKKNNYDYYEGGFGEFVTMDDEKYNALYKESEKHGLYCETTNGFFTPGIALNGDIDFKFIADYVEKGISRVERLGCKIAVLGSGAARKVPDGYDRDLAEKQFVEVLKLCGDIAGKHNIQIAIEPLNHTETNLINTVAEGIEFCKRADNENVRCLADFFHVFMSGESYDAIINAKEMLIHTHIARANLDRSIPTIADIEDCKPWAEALRKGGYKGRLSLEGGFRPDFDTAIVNVLPILDLFRDI